MSLLHLAHLVTLPLDRNTRLDPALVALKVRQIDDLRTAGRPQRALPVVVQSEVSVGWTRVLRQHIGRSLEGDTAREQLLPGVGSDSNTLRPQGYIDAARIPEASLGVYEIVPRRANEGCHGHVTTVVRQQITLHLAHGHAVI